MPGNYRKFMQLEIGGYTKHLPIDGQQLATINNHLVPSKLNHYIQQYCKIGFAGVLARELTHPNMDITAFDLFRNLMIMPKNIPIYNPYNLTEDDLEPIFRTFAYYSGANKQEQDSNVIKLLKDRLHNKLIR